MMFPGPLVKISKNARWRMIENSSICRSYKCSSGDCPGILISSLHQLQQSDDEENDRGKEMISLCV